MANITTLTKQGCFDADLENAINANFTNLNTVLTTPFVSSQLDPTTIQYLSGAVANAQVLTLHTVGVAILPAQGAGTLIEIVSMVLENVFLTAAYANGGAIQLSYGAAPTTTIPASATIAATFLTSPTASQSILVAGALASNLSSAVLNTAVSLNAATADFITGAGSLKYRIAYRVHSGL